MATCAVTKLACLFVAYLKAIEEHQMSTGQVVGRAMIPGDAWGGITIAHSSLLVGTVDGTLCRFALGSTRHTAGAG
jgi:hypothetical protein